MADAPKLTTEDLLYEGVPKINAAIDNANEALKVASKAEMNIIDVANDMLEDLGTEVQAFNYDDEVNLITSNSVKNNKGATVTSVTNSEEQPFSYDLLKQYLRIIIQYQSVDSGLAAHFVTNPLAVDSSKKQIGGFWVRKSDLDSLLTSGVNFFVSAIGFNSNKQWSGVPDSVLSFEIPPNLISTGYTLTRNNPSQNATLKVKAKVGDWVYFEIKHNIVPNFPYWSIFIGTRRTNTNILGSLKLDIMNLTLVNAKNIISPFGVYSIFENYKIRKQELDSNIFTSQRKILNAIYKEHNLLTSKLPGRNQTNEFIVNDETKPFDKELVPTILRMDYSFSGATNAYIEYKPKQYENGKTPTASVWLRKSQVNSLENMNLQFWLCNTDKNGVWAGVSGATAFVQLTPSDFYRGFKTGATNATESFTLSLEVKYEVDDWIYVEWEMTDQPGYKYNWTPLLAIQGVINGNYSGTLDLMNYRAINTEFGLAPLLINTIMKSKWAFKKWGVVGDSISEWNFRTNKNYHDYISDIINCFVYNYGVSGTGWRTPNSAGTGRPIHERIGIMDPSLDLITVFAGINDWIQTGMPLVIGEFGDTDPAVSLYGAIENTLKQLITKYPTKTIAVFTPLPSGDAFNGPNSSGIYLEQVVDAIIKVANKYSIPVLDLYRKSSLFPWNDTANDIYFKAVGQADGDRLHPNDAGHKILSDKILTFLNSL